jgi:hypothetical protein
MRKTMAPLKLGGAEVMIQILAMIRLADMHRADASALPGPSTSTAPRGDGEGLQETFDDAVRILLPTVVFLYNTNPFF